MIHQNWQSLLWGLRPERYPYLLSLPRYVDCMVRRSKLMVRKYNKLSRDALKMLLDGVSSRKVKQYTVSKKIFPQLTYFDLFWCHRRGFWCFVPKLITQQFDPSCHCGKADIHSFGGICHRVVLVNNQLSGFAFKLCAELSFSLEHLCCSEVSISPLFRWPNSVCHLIHKC